VPGEHPALRSGSGPGCVHAPAEIAGGIGDALPADIAALGEGRVAYVSLGTVPVFNQLATFNVLLEAVVTEDLDVVVTIGADNGPATLAAPRTCQSIGGCRCVRCSITATRSSVAVAPGLAGSTQRRPAIGARTSRRSLRALG
jgi:hypothetical protein